MRTVPVVLANRSFRLNLGDSPAVAAAKACVAATELIRRREVRDDVTTTPGRTFFMELSAALRKLWRGEEITSLNRLARGNQTVVRSNKPSATLLLLLRSYKARERSVRRLDRIVSVLLLHPNPSRSVEPPSDCRSSPFVESFVLPTGDLHQQDMDVPMFLTLIVVLVVVVVATT
jgi:hypothetical protein